MWNSKERMAAVAHAVRSGHRVDILGRHGSGRTFLLRHLDENLRLDGWDTLIVRGVAPLREFPLAALGFATSEAPSDRRTPPSLRGLMTMLRERAELGKFAVLVDDFDHLDDASWGVIAAARNELRMPLTITRLPHAAASFSPPASASEAALTIQLGPLSFEEIQGLVETLLGSTASGQLVSRVFAKSGGFPGVATAIVDAAQRAGRLARLDGAWHVSGELWDAQLVGLMENHLDAVTGEEREALETLSWAGIVEIDTAARLIGWDILEALESSTLVNVVPSGSRQLAVIVPPLLVEYFLHQPPSARRIRLTRQIGERLAPEQRRPMDSPAGVTPFVSEPDALFIRLLQEQQAISRSIAQSNWAHAGTLDSAVEYIGQLIDAAAPVDVIDGAFEASRGLAGNEEQTALFTILHADWLVRAHHDDRTARDSIEAARPRTGEYEGIIDAGLMIMDTRIGRIGDYIDTRLRISEDAPTIVRGRLLEARVHAYIARGEVKKAERAFAALQALDGYTVRPVAAALSPLIEFARGNLALAAQQAMELFEQARDRLDPNELRTAAYVGACAFSAMGMLHRVGEILDTIIAMGASSVPLKSETLAVHGFGVMVNYHTRRQVVGHHNVSEFAIESELSGLLPGMHWSWSKSHQRASEGDFAGASALLWTEAAGLWERGGRLAGALGMLSAIEMDPDADRLEIAADRVGQLDSHLADGHLLYVSALVSRDGARMRDAAEEFARQGRLGPARLAYRFAETWLSADGDAQSAHLAEQARQRLFDNADSGDFDYRQFRTNRPDLTERENEIAQMVAHGFTNPEIARELVVSIRTVESHLNNVAKKLESTSREDLIRRYADYLDGTLL